MTQDVAIKSNMFLPQSFEQAQRYAEMIANSSLCPTNFKNKSGDVFIAMQMGAEVGLSPMQAIQNIAVIHGKPSLYADGMLAVVRVHPNCEAIRQWIDGEGDNRKAYCGIKRRGQPEEIRSFSVADAKKASLWNKAGAWANYPDRMLNWRATGWCCRDVFADALRGLQCAEEQNDYIDVTVMPENEKRELIDIQQKIEKGTPVSLTYNVDKIELDKWIDKINNAEALDVLQVYYKDAKIFCNGDKVARNDVSKATRERKTHLESYKKKPTPAMQDSKEKIVITSVEGTETTSEWLNQYAGEVAAEVKHG